ncbi:hypothetical protein A3C94_00080 [Candidatus Kaiserbacteria bacterium RIFCSPHIGHO2_02_FULL_55_17]|uniref:Uncharacterized protein n=1 Tax=Candidatus Kaiserbacteria bacterium RIFCSPHIGHO2_02_FULL_55_17 TaxID=1798496 RepID=A0A1F6DTW1_9BACT|nr:MAG: hypothetical protein A3C94_00080 [Candidatus Kaiserbacteria bacterium RIFCSPHIGHO2_02_FULL_55_17]
MTSNEGIRQINETLISDNSNRPPAQESELKREYYFRALVLSHLLNTVRESLENAGFSESEIDEFTNELAKLPEDDQFAVLAIPFELRDGFFEKYHKKIEDGQISVADAVEDIRSINKQYGFTVGYHLSDHQIPRVPETNNRAWNINGSEFDDRDEMKMAYYSEDYLHRYKKKPGRFLYIVRAETGSRSAHKKDLANRWSRAPLLSVIDECDMKEINREINKAIEKEEAAPQKEAA